MTGTTVIVTLNRDIILRYPKPQTRQQIMETLADQILRGMHDKDFKIKTIEKEEGS